MIVDTSALIAILHGEPDHDLMVEMLASHRARISAANWLEGVMVAERDRQARSAERYEGILRAAAVTIEPVSVEQARAARVAFLRYGRGSGSPAKLNFGDCFAYALSATAGEPLLFKGDDFRHTDVWKAIE